MSEQRNVLLAIVLSVAVLMLWDAWVARQKPPPSAVTESSPAAGIAPSAPEPYDPVLSDPPISADPPPRARIATPRLRGSINLRGARIDDLFLSTYRQTIDPASEPIRLFAPPEPNGPGAYFADFGWRAAQGSAIRPPGPNAVWSVESPNSRLTPETPLRLIHKSGSGLIFRMEIAVDAHYMFTIAQSVENRSGQAVSFAPHAGLFRVRAPEGEGFYLLHEGFIADFPEEDGLEEIDFGDLEGEPPAQFNARGGWAGVTDKYWAAVLIPDSQNAVTARFSETPRNGQIVRHVALTAPVAAIPAGGRQAVSWRLFAGAKQVALIDNYEEQANIPQFDLLIDWGWFYWLTKPMFLALDFIYSRTGNFGIAILILTILIRILFFPLASKSYVALSGLRKLQPEIEKMRERYKDDRARINQEMIALYRREKVSPLPGCLPILLQIPVFFAIYKVLFVTIEMRHAPFFGWIADLSAPDPTSLLTLFGLLPFSTPDFLTIGVWPILMGMTLFVQMRLNPASPDPVQRAIFAWFPVVLTVALARFPAGLVIYWSWSNFLSILQQAYIMKRQGVEIALLDNLAALFSRRPPK